jgi:hypothetical protein
MAAAQVMMKMGVSPGLPPIAERVPADKRDALKKMIASAGVPEAALDRMETWAAALTLMAVSFRQMGLSTDEGVERSLSAGYAKPVKGLETVDQQFGFFDQLSEEAQRALLTGLVDKPGEAKAEFEAMLGAWRSGDTDAIARTFDSEKALSPELRSVLMAKRNANWAEWLAKRLDQPGTVLVAVGAGHLAGKGSVQEHVRHVPHARRQARLVQRRGEDRFRCFIRAGDGNRSAGKSGGAAAADHEICGLSQWQDAVEQGWAWREGEAGQGAWFAWRPGRGHGQTGAVVRFHDARIRGRDEAWPEAGAWP